MKVIEGYWNWHAQLLAHAFSKLRPDVLSKTLSHIWGNLNLPMFLFNVGLLTLMNMDSIIFLAKVS